MAYFTTIPPLTRGAMKKALEGQGQLQVFLRKTNRVLVTAPSNAAGNRELEAIRQEGQVYTGFLLREFPEPVQQDNS